MLSELTYRGKVGTLLIVAISEVISSWEDVMQHKFGLGNSLLVITEKNGKINIKDKGDVKEISSSKFRWSDYIETDDRRPKQPVLVDLEVFKTLSATKDFAKMCLFDMIIVDEAHELCNESNIAAMGLLSRMIAEKKRDGTGNEGYCLLLSATPHNGNLKGMFPLWYFICRRGGNPDEFFTEENGGKRHEKDYNDEYRFYSQTVCYGADNISDFVRKKKIYDFSPIGDADSSSRKALKEYLTSKGQDISDFDGANEWVREKMVDEFIEKPENEKWKKTVKNGIANAYRTLLSLIMIRQSKDTVQTIDVGKKTVNVYLCPVDKGQFKGCAISGIPYRQYGNLKLDYTGVIGSFPEKYYPDVITGEGVKRNLFDMADGDKQKFYADIINSYLSRLYPDTSYNAGFKSGFKNYYRDMMANFDSSGTTYSSPEQQPNGQYNLFVPYEKTGESSSYDNKMSYVRKILKKHSDERVIMFFDYDLTSNDEVVYEDGHRDISLYDKIEQDLKSDYPNSERDILCIDASTGVTETVEKKFNSPAYHNCILIVKGGFTHGANLQKAAVIINFQVSCDPVDTEQKIGRIFRLGQDNSVTVYSLADVDSLEGYALAYFTRIGLFAADSGDATILSGCNESEMVTVRCSECDNIQILPKDEYEALKEELKIKDGGKEGYISRVNLKTGATYINVFEKGRDNSYKTGVKINATDDRIRNPLMCASPSHTGGDICLMSPINNGEFVCSRDKSHKLMRGRIQGDEGYKCMDLLARTMCGTGGKGNRHYFCNKLCAISMCEEHKIKFPDCEAVKAFEAKEPYAACVDKCYNSSKGGKCTNFEQCKNGVGTIGCSCMPPMSADEMELSVSACETCIAYNDKIKYNFGCKPRPHILKFDNDWTGAECPICRSERQKGDAPGILQKVPMKTFSEHIRYLWDIERTGESRFCAILGDEAKKVGEIEDILKESGHGDSKDY